MPMNFRGFIGTLGQAVDGHYFSPAFLTVLARAGRDARRSRPEACSSLGGGDSVAQKGGTGLWPVDFGVPPKSLAHHLTLAK
jgi:hypothetical protein